MFGASRVYKGLGVEEEWGSDTGVEVSGGFEGGGG